jgi:hypothetical protein
MISAVPVEVYLNECSKYGYVVASMSYPAGELLVLLDALWMSALRS